MRLLIMGPQGVGKGTQAALLSEHYGIPAISTGDIFRYNIKNKTELGVEALMLQIQSIISIISAIIYGINGRIYIEIGRAHV